MGRFLLQVVLFLALQTTLFAILLANYDVSSETNYFARIVEKHQRLATTPPPRIILIGGSNVPFGFDSEEIERSLGRPVINMGLAAGLGVEFMLADLEPELRRGDAVVLSLEYDHFSRGAGRGGGFDPAVLQQVLIYRPEGIRSLRPIHIRKIVLDRGLTLLGEIARHAFHLSGHTKPAGSQEVRSARAAFNPWGDLVGNRHDPPRISAGAVESIPLLVKQPDFPNKTLLRHLREFIARCQSRGVRVFFTFPPKPAATLRRDSAAAQTVAAALAQIPGLIILDTPQDHAYPSGQFFDTANHLTGEGAEIRTARLVAELRKYLNAPGTN